MRDTRVPPLSPASARHIDQICDRFEAAWKSDQRPHPENFLEAVEEPDRSALLRQLLLLDWDYRRRVGDQPRTDDYTTRFPSDTTLIEVVSREISEALADTLNGTADRYELDREIGRGGIGVVFRGRDRILGRELAVKVLGDAHLDKPEARRRFLDEARVGSQLQHPGIVPVYDLGCLGEQRPFFTMKLVEGETLAEILKARGDIAQDVSRLLGILEQVCQAVGYAHDRGIIHRDLKPANIMVGAFGEVQVMDWGFAKALGTEGVSPSESDGILNNGSRASQSGALMGTLAYMPPEQARGLVSRLDARGDVFALGAILCEILTGLPPYGSGSADEIHAKASTADLSEAHARLDACIQDEPLKVLAKNCLAPDPDARPTNAALVARELSAYRVAAQEQNRQAQIDRATAEARAAEAAATALAERRARRLTVALATTALVLLMLGGAGLWWRKQVGERQAMQIAGADSRVEAALAEAGDLQNRGDWSKASAAVMRARALLDSGASDRWTQPTEAALADLDMVAQLEDIRRLQSQYDFATLRYPRERVLPRYAEAYAGYGIVVGSDAASAAARIADRPEPIRDVLVAGLDNWWLIAQRQGDVTHEWLGQILQTIDTDPLRSQVRSAVANQDRHMLEQLAKTGAPADGSPAAVTSLTWALLEFGAADGVIALLRPVQQQHPNDFWINFDLGQAYSQLRPPNFAESLRYYSMAQALRPETQNHVTLGYLFLKAQDWDAAIAVSRQAIALGPNDATAAEAFNHLGIGLARKGEWQQAEAAFNHALELKPGLGIAHYNLGHIMARKGQSDRAIEEYERAIAMVSTGNPYRQTPYLNEELAGAHYSLGLARYGRKEYAAALACLDRALELNPSSAAAHFLRGNALDDLKRTDDAIAAYQQAIRFQPQFERAHYNLGTIWQHRGQLDRAIATYQKAIELNPKLADSHYNLGSALRDSGDLDGAAAEFAKAAELDPKLAQAQWNLGTVLVRQGLFREALVWIERGQKLGAAAHMDEPSDLWLKKAKRYAELEARLAAILDGRDQLANAQDRIDCATVCKLKRLYGASARFYEDDIAASPELVTETPKLRYEAACVAALASADQGQKSDQQAHWRTRALEWLRADFALWTQRFETAPADHASVQSALDRLRHDKDLASLREPEELAKLPASERIAFLRFWADVNELLARALANSPSP